jgi:hypothetical protein
MMIVPGRAVCFPASKKPDPLAGSSNITDGLPADTFVATSITAAG